MDDYTTEQPSAKLPKKRKSLEAPEGYKICRNCTVSQPLDQFRKNSTRSDGYGNWCKDCNRAYARDYKKRPKVAAKRRAQSKRARADQRPYVKVAYLKAQEWRANNPDAPKAHWSIHKAIKAGIIPDISTQSCANCGQRADHYHHHKGYAPEHELDVIPLCRSCHQAVHRELS